MYIDLLRMGQLEYKMCKLSGYRKVLVNDCGIHFANTEFKHRSDQWLLYMFPGLDCDSLFL